MVNRCLVPLTSFLEPGLQPNGKNLPAWFAHDQTRPLAFFAGVFGPQWWLGETRKADSHMIAVRSYFWARLFSIRGG